MIVHNFSRFSANRLDGSWSSSFSLSLSLSPLDRETIEARRDPGSRSSLDPFRRPLALVAGMLSRSRGSITKVGTHFHVATRRTGSFFFSFCFLSPSLPPSSLPYSFPSDLFHDVFASREFIDFISKKSALAFIVANMIKKNSFRTILKTVRGINSALKVRSIVSK